LANCFLLLKIITENSIQRIWLFCKGYFAVSQKYSVRDGIRARGNKSLKMGYFGTFAGKFTYCSPRALRACLARFGGLLCRAAS